MTSFITLIVLLYLAAGLVVGVLFVLLGVRRVDPVAGDSSWLFRVVILPGCVGLWPVVLGKWWGSCKGGGA